MNEPSPSSTNNAPNSPLPQPTLSTGLAEDEDEPPSSNGTLTIDKPQLQSQSDAEMRGGKEEEEIDCSTTNPELAPAKVVERRMPRRNTGVSGRSRRPTRLERLKALVTPNKPIGPTPTYKESVKAAIRYTPLNVCLLFIPVSWALHYTEQSDTLTFVFSALGIVPLAAMLGFGTEQIALRTTSSIGGLLNATLGNIVEMIIAGIALNRVSVALFTPIN